MSGYLVKNQRGDYFHVDDASIYKQESVIKIPEGAEVLVIFDDNIRDYCFYKENYTFGSDDRDDNNWWEAEVNISAIEERGGKIVWQRKESYVVDVDAGNRDNGDSEFIKHLHYLDENTTSVEKTLNERQSQYGCFEDVAFVTENIISIMKRCGYDNMPHPHRMAMYMIASKMARLVNGDHNHLDSWHDIGGYAKLIENLIGGENE